MAIRAYIVNVIGSIRTKHQRSKTKADISILEFIASSSNRNNGVRRRQFIKRSNQLDKTETEEIRYFRSINSHYGNVTAGWLNWVTENAENSFKRPRKCNHKKHLRKIDCVTSQWGRHLAVMPSADSAFYTASRYERKNIQIQLPERKKKPSWNSTWNGSFVRTFCTLSSMRVSLCGLMSTTHKRMESKREKQMFMFHAYIARKLLRPSQSQWNVQRKANLFHLFFSLPSFGKINKKSGRKWGKILLLSIRYAGLFFT